ncbi:uncharacterized protein [Drosophila takahashii]|uniref:uncharacterized protein n=1 Tax=Drosophila takahashii TaxID=29030 RepID=UPI003899526D
MHIKICIVLLAIGLNQTLALSIVSCLINNAENFISSSVEDLRAFFANLKELEALINEVIPSSKRKEVIAEVKEIVTDIVSNEVFQKCLSGPNTLSDLKCFTNAFLVEFVKAPQTVMSIVKDSNLLAFVEDVIRSTPYNIPKLTAALEQKITQNITKLIEDIKSCAAA